MTKQEQKNILVTGGAGYVGSHCAKALARSRIWSQDAHVAKGVIAPAGRIFADQVGADPADLEKTYDEIIAGALAEEGRT